MLENHMKMAKTVAEENKPNDEWLTQCSGLKELAKKARPVGEDGQVSFKKLARLDLREMGGSAEEPTVMLCKAINSLREVKTENMEKPVPVIDVLALGCDASEMKAYMRGEEPVVAKFPEEYSVWFNTTVAKSEIVGYAGGKLDEEKNVVELGEINAGEEFIIASYGTVPSKRNKKLDVYIFKILPRK